MLYKELKRANDLDTAIAELHEHLAELYKERANLLQPNGTVPSISKKAPATLEATQSDVEKQYEELKATWNNLGASFPQLKTLEKKLRQACSIALQLKHDNPSLNGQVTVLAIPPFKTLEKVLDGGSGQAKRFTIDPESLAHISKNKGWTLAVSIAPDFSLPIYGLNAFLERQDFVYNDHDCRGMGIQELIAAELQNVATVTEGSWTVLLKDRPDGESVWCATLEDDHIVFQLEDTDCLLGENYLRLMVGVN